MPTWYYFNKPSHLQYHNFTRNKRPPKNLRSLLGLGLKFIPTPRFTNKWAPTGPLSMTRLRRSIHLRFFFAGQPDDDSDYDPKIYVASKWSPPSWIWPERQVDERLNSFVDKISLLFKKQRGRTNLLPHHHRALRRLQQQPDFLIVPCDKNLGPSIIQIEDYLDIAFRDHLNDTTTYQMLTPTQVAISNTQIENSVKVWLDKNKKILSAMEKKFLRNGLAENDTAFGRFYLTLKAHKLKAGQGLNELKSRPIVSCPGSLLHPLGVWVDRKLQQLAQSQRSYFKNSYELKQQLSQLHLPPNARYFTADAVSMYTNIPTNYALLTLSRYFKSYRLNTDNSFPADAVGSALSLIMRNNVFTFGDMHFKQLNGTAMGTPPAPPYATIYYGIHENSFLDKYKDSLLFYRRFIDDVVGIWLCHPDRNEDQRLWSKFQHEMNAYKGLTWEFSSLSLNVDFMDLTLSIHDNRTVTTLFEKPLNLHLYIPPHSAHPPGLLPGIVYGTLFRIFTLCSDSKDKEQRTRLFFRRLIVRGYKSDNIRPLFHKAIAAARAYTGPSNSCTSIQAENLIFHLPFHPNDPQSHEIQRAWKESVAEPQYKMPFCNMRNPRTKAKCGIQRMIIAYRRPMNLGNLLSHRNIQHGPPASSFYKG